MIVQRVVKNTLFLSVSQALSRVIGFFYTIFLARALGVENFGVYIFTLAFLYNFIPVADFGIEKLILRDIPRTFGKTSFYLARLLPLRFFLVFSAYLMMIFMGFLLGQSSQQVFFLAILGLSLLPYNLIYFLASFPAAQEKMQWIALANILTTTLIAILGVIFVLVKLSLVWILMAYFWGNLLVLLIFLVWMRKWSLSFGWIVDKKFWFRILAQSWVFAALTILSVFYLRFSVIMVGVLQGAVMVGFYGAAFRFIEALILFPQSLALALFPLSSRLFATDPAKLKSVYKRGLGILLLLSLPFAFLLIFSPQFVINLVYGPDYLKTASILPILGLAVMLFFLNALPGNIILNSSKVNYFLPVVIFYFVVELVLCLILIPRYLLTGAAWAVLGGEAVALVINNLFVWRILRD